MSLIKCPKCGEMFSDSYKECPFCAEDEEFFSGKKPKNPGRRVENAKSPSILGPALVVVLLLLAGFLVYTFFGDTIAGWFNGDGKPGTEQTDPQGGESDPTSAALSLDQTTMKLTVGETKVLTANGAENISWTSSDEAVATVAADGTITAVAAGEATVTAVAGDQSAACTVTVTDEAQPEPEPQPEKEPEQKKDLAMGTVFGDLPKNDSGNWEFSASVGESFGMEVSGTDANVTWSSSNTSVAAVAADGTFTAVGSGEAVLTATVDGQTLKCDVRVG